MGIGPEPDGGPASPRAAVAPRALAVHTGAMSTQNYIPRHQQRVTTLAESAARGVSVHHDDLRRYRVTRVLQATMADEPLTGIEADIERTLGGSVGTGNALGKTITVPFSVFGSQTRAATTTTSPLVAAGAVTVGAPAEALNSVSVVAAAGVTFASGAKTDLQVPSTAAPPAMTWIGDELTPVPDVTPAMNLAAMKPHVAIGTIKVSGRLLRQAAPQVAEFFVRRQLLLAAGAAIDKAILQGRADGNMAAPMGLTATPVQTFEVAAGAGNLLDDGIAPAMEYVLNQTGTDDDAAFIVGVSARKRLLPWMEMHGGNVLGRRVHASAAMPAESIAYGRWSSALATLWGEGIEIVADPFTGFKTDQISVRCMIALDCIFPSIGPFALVKYTP